MQHIDEFTLMMYADDELTPQEQHHVATHLSCCNHCREALTRWQADQAMLTDSFRHFAPALTELPLSAFVCAQVNEIASLYKREHQSARRLLGWIITCLGSLLILSLFAQNRWMAWVGTLWSTWVKSFVWTWTFWLKENASDFLLIPQRNPYAISFLFSALLLVLVILNARRVSGGQWNQSDGGMQK